MIAVTGATGHLGQLVVEQLIQKVPATEVVAVVRNRDKAAKLEQLGVQLRVASYEDAATLEAAFYGVDKLLFISGSEVGKRLAQHAAVVNAAKDAHVKLLVYTSLLRADQAQMSLATEHVATEQAIRESGVPFVLLRNSWYTENYTENLATALQHGALLGAAKDGRIAAAPRADYAAAAVTVLTSSGHEGKAYELGGDQPFTLSELAAEVAKQAGKPVVYNDLPAEQYAATLQSFGLPEPFAKTLASADEGIARGELETHSGDLRRLIGRPTTPLSQSVATGLARL
jgi:NAD(P)H dehydrogenase (quinone)